MSTSNQELKRSIKENQKKYIDKLLSILKEDPDATEYTKNYAELEEYLHEVMEKDGSVLYGLISSLEVYLEK